MNQRSRAPDARASARLSHVLKSLRQGCSQSAQRESNPHIRHGKVVGSPLHHGRLLREPDCQRSKSTGPNSNGRRRRPPLRGGARGAESSPLSAVSGPSALDYQVASVGMVGLEPTTACPRNTWACRYPTSRLFPVRTAGFEPRAPTDMDVGWSLLVPDQARCQASPRSVADRAQVDRSGLGGARILVSGSSDRRSTVSATSPNKKPDVAVTPGFHVSPAKSVAECHKRQWRRGCVFAG